MTCGGAALAEAGVPAAEAPSGGVFGAADAVSYCLGEIMPRAALRRGYCCWCIAAICVATPFSPVPALPLSPSIA